jgi:hypothetical protein
MSAPGRSARARSASNEHRQLAAATAAARPCAASRIRRWCRARAASPTTWRPRAAPHRVRAHHRRAWPHPSHRPRRRARCPAWSRSTPAPTWSRPASSRCRWPPAFQRPDGTPMAAPPKRALAWKSCATSASRWWRSSPRRAQAAQGGRRERSSSTTEDLPVVNVDPLRALQPGAPVVWPKVRPTTSAPRCATAMPPPPRPLSRVPRTRVSWTSSTSVWRRRRWSRAACWAYRRRRPTADGAPVQPDAHRRARQPGGRRHARPDAAERARVIGDVGGGFGMKTGFYPEDVVIAWAARHAKRPVKWQRRARRGVPLRGARARRHSGRAELALDADGRVLALRVQSLANVGAYALPHRVRRRSSC